MIRFKAQQGYQINSVREHIIGTLDSVQPVANMTNNANLKETVSFTENNKPLSDLYIENKYSKSSETNEKISSSKLAKKLGLKTNEFLNEMVEHGYLVMNGDKHNLSKKGESLGVEHITKSRFGAHFLWPEDLVLTEENSQGN